MTERLDVELVANVLDLNEINQLDESSLRRLKICRSNYQLEDHLLLVHVLQFVARPSLRSVNTTRRTVLALRTASR